jgi:cytochrome P450
VTAQSRDYTFNCINYVNDVTYSALALNAIPRLLRPVFAPLLTIPNRIHHGRALKHLKPFFEQQSAVQARDPSDVSCTYASWSIEHAMQVSEPAVERTPEMLSRRIMAMNFAAIHTSTLVVNSFLLDLLSDSTGNSIRQLNEESQVLAREYDGQEWNRARVMRYVRLDSALRESMRLSGFLQRALLRKVVAPQGATLPDGTQIPHDTVVCVSGQAIHHDPVTYPDPFSYRPERFLSTLTTDQVPSVANDRDILTSSKPGTPMSPVDSSEKWRSANFTSTLAPSRKGLTKTAAESDPNYLSWGLGRHACPGRFFATDLVKMVALHAVTHYDIEPVKRDGDRPWMEYHEIPPIGTKLRIRRKPTVF